MHLCNLCHKRIYRTRYQDNNTTTHGICLRELRTELKALQAQTKRQMAERPVCLDDVYAKTREPCQYDPLTSQ